MIYLLKEKKGLQLLIFKKKIVEKKQTLIDMKYLKIKAVIFKIDKRNFFARIQNIEMYSTHNKGRPVIGERLIKIIKTKFKNT